MSRRSKTSLVSVLFVITILACSINNIEISTQPDLELTITAQALILQQNGQAPGAVDPLAPVAVNPSDPGAVNPPAAAVVNTPTPGVANTLAAGAATVTVSVETNCRKGPGLIYDSVYSMPVSQVAEVIGKNTFTNYWIIKIPGSGSTCWLWGKYATVSGNVGALVEFATPTPAAATATNKPPTATTAPILTSPTGPSGLNMSLNCADQGGGIFLISGFITWTDNSNNESGFRIYQNDIEIGTTGPDATSFSIAPLTSPAGTEVIVNVHSFNAAGYSIFDEARRSCP